MVTLRDLANELHEDRSVLRKWIRKQFGINAMQLQRDPSGSGAMVLVIKENFVDDIRQRRREWLGNDARSFIEVPDRGFFYAMLLCPDLSLARYKFGYAGDVEKRAADHRTICPTLKVVDQWPCEPCMEKAGLLVVAKYCNQVGGEVFDVTDWVLLKTQLDSLYSLLY